MDVATCALNASQVAAVIISQHVPVAHEAVATVAQSVVAAADFALYPAGQVYVLHFALAMQQLVFLFVSVAAVFFHASFVPTYIPVAQVGALRPPHLVTSFSQQVVPALQLAALPEHSVVATLSFFLYPAGQVASLHLALVKQHSAALFAVVAALLDHASTRSPTLGKYLELAVQSAATKPTPAHVAVSSSQHPVEVAQVDAPPLHLFAALAVAFFIPAGHV